MRRLALAIALVALVAVFTAAAGAAPGGPRVIETAEGGFPERSFLLMLPDERRLTANDVRVTENGKTVSDVSLVPASEAADRSFGVVLAIDASKSMRGEPIEQAMAAARAFAERRNANQQIAVVTFNSTAHVVLPFTDDSASIDQALAETPVLAGGTALYDGIDEALALVESADVASASIVVLSDGKDVGSTIAGATAVDRARDAHVRIFSVGLRSRQFDAPALRELGEGTRGSFVEASSPNQLEPIYEALGADLAGEYLLRYRSLAGPGQDIEVVVEVTGFDQPATTGYRTPALPTAPAAGAFERPATDTVWGSVWAMVLVVIASSTLLALAVFTLVSRRRPGLVTRVSAFVSITRPDEKNPRASLHDAMVTGTEQSLSRMRWWGRFCEEVEIGKMRLQPAQIALFTAFGTLLTVLVLNLVGGLVFAVLGLGVPFVARSFVKRAVARQRKLFADQLPDNLQVLGSALRAGHSFVGALSVVVDDAAEPSRTEFRRVVADERLGVPLETSLDAVARRMASRELDQVSVVAAIQRVSGGNSAEVLDRVAETVRERAQLRRLVQTLTAQGRMARWIVSLLPVFLLIVMGLLNRDYAAPLFTEPIGRVLLAVAAVMVTMGSLVIKRIVDIKV